MPTAKEAFLTELGHDEGHHRTIDLEAGEGELESSIGAHMRRMAARKTVAWPMLDHCGWWFCFDSDPAGVRWDDLREALGILKANGRDPWSIDAANVAGHIRLFDGWASEKIGYERLEAALRNVNVEGDAERLKRKALEELAPLLRNARLAKPDQNRPGNSTDTAMRAALTFAQQLAWTPEDVAAILVLVGVDSSRFASVKKKVQEMHRRMQREMARI